MCLKNHFKYTMFLPHTLLCSLTKFNFHLVDRTIAICNFMSKGLYEFVPFLFNKNCPIAIARHPQQSLIFTWSIAQQQFATGMFENELQHSFSNKSSPTQSLLQYRESFVKKGFLLPPIVPNWITKRPHQSMST